MPDRVSSQPSHRPSYGSSVTSTAVPPASTTTSRTGVCSRDNRSGWLLVLPSVLVLGVLTLYPLATIVTGAASADGVEAVSRLVGSPGFAQMMINTVQWVVLSTTGALLLGFGAALALQHRQVRFAGLWRSLLIVPWVTPLVVTATVWKWMYSTDYGTVNAALLAVGVISEPVTWLTNSALVLPALAAVQVWATFPFVMLMVSAGLQAIPDELVEAAQLDGAGVWRVFTHVTLPGLRDIAFIVSLIITVWSLNAFVPIWIITRGGPGGASNILPVQLYQAFQNGSSADVSVIAVLQLVASMALAWFYVQRTRKADA